jgi:hypothetical protein
MANKTSEEIQVKDLDNWKRGQRGFHTEDISTTTFLANLYGASAHSTSFNFGFTWIAIGPA